MKGGLSDSKGPRIERRWAGGEGRWGCGRRLRRVRGGEWQNEANLGRSGLGCGVYGRGSGWAGDRRGGGDGFGLEFFEGLESAVIGSAGCVNAVLEFGEGSGVAGGGLSERVLLFVGVGALGLVLPHLSFGGAVAPEEHSQWMTSSR